MYKVGFWILLIVVIVGLVGGAYYFGQRTGQMQQEANEVEVIETKLPATSSPSAQVSDKNLGMATPLATPKATPVITFEAAGSIPDSDKQQIQQRIINPLVDYYAEQGEERQLVSLTISPNNQQSKAQSPYLGQAVFKNGGNSGFVINKTNGQIEWWGVDCMICTFSNEYKQKYPEVVKDYL